MPVERKVKSAVEMYGLWWPPAIHPLQREFDMINKGGKWKKKDGTWAGEGLFFHYKRAIQIIWPYVTWHRWLDLLLKCYLGHRTMGIVGPASSGKTFFAALIALVDFYVAPSFTTVIVCSTTKERLEDRIWGEIKKHHRLARENISWLPGNLIEGRQRIIMDKRMEFADGRDFRQGLCGVPCFPSGTLVDTPSGAVPIEQLRVGQKVINAIGIGTITETHKRVSLKLLRLHLSDGRQVDCTEDHLIFTQKGWTKARDLETFDMVFSTHETMSIMRKGSSEQYHILLSEVQRGQAMSFVRKSYRGWLSKSQILQLRLSRFFARETMRAVWRGVQAVEPKERMERWWKFGSVLFSSMCRKMGRTAQGMCKENNKRLRALWEENGYGSFRSKVLFQKVPRPLRCNPLQAMRPTIYIHSRISIEAAHFVLQQALQVKGGWREKPETQSASNARRIGSVENVPRIHCSLSSQDGPKVQRRQQALVSTGHSISINQTGNRNRRRGSQHTREENQRRETYQNIGKHWVDHIEVLESGSDPRFRKSEGGYTVHNIEVSGHPSYSVNGIIVHNCKKGNETVGLSEFAGLKNKRMRLFGDEGGLIPRVFVDAVSNLDKNPDFKAVLMGNPKETTDALGVFCEPSAKLGGWDGGIDQAPGTKTWETRRPDGICVQLPGDDSPNLDGKLGIPLITQEQIDRDVAFYGRDSLWFTMMNLGRMPRGQGSRRILTRHAAQKNRAMDDPVWKNSDRTRIGFLDAAFGGVGGDRCVFGELQFGQEAYVNSAEDLATNIISQATVNHRNKSILALIGTMIVPIVTGQGSESAEDQIATFCKDQCEQRGINPANFFFDVGMKSALVGAFSRIWSPLVVSIDCGGKPTERRVSNDINVPCREYYSKLITELWFSVRLIVHAGQFRGMTEDALMEFCAREWTMVGGNKHEVEPKSAMKLKSGRSPDLADAIVIGCEGARRRGFEIQQMENSNSVRVDFTWKRELREKAKALAAGRSLNYAA